MSLYISDCKFTHSNTNLSKQGLLGFVLHIRYSNKCGLQQY